MAQRQLAGRDRVIGGRAGVERSHGVEFGAGLTDADAAQTGQPVVPAGVPPLAVHAAIRSAGPQAHPSQGAELLDGGDLLDQPAAVVAVDHVGLERPEGTGQFDEQ